MRHFPCSLFLVLTAAPLLPAQVVYAFTATLDAVNPLAPGFPSSLAGIGIGAPVTGLLRYDASSPAVPNPFVTPFSLATRYALNNASLQLTVGSVAFNFTTSLNAFVWNDDPISGGPSDGFLVLNVAGTGAQAQVGNLLLPTSTWSSEALPVGSIAGGMVMQLSALGSSTAWVHATWQNLVLAPIASYTVFGPGCTGTLGIPGNVVTNLPRIGQTMTANFTNLAFNVAFVLIGWSNTSSAFGPLPLDLTLIGAPTCFLRVSLDVATPISGAGGTATYSLAVPNSVTVLGFTLHTQALSFDTVNPFGAVLSDAATVVVGV
jgi:hypothetical protein